MIEMNKSVLTSFAILCLLSTVFLMGLGLNIQTVKAGETVYIRADGSVDPATAPIERIGDIYVLKSNINDSLVVERSNIIVDGDGCALQGSGIGKGIDLTATSNVTIKNMEIRAFEYGIWLYKPYQSSNSKILENMITNNTYGVWVFASDNTLSKNTVANSSYSGVIIDIGSSGNTISGNNIMNNTRGIWLILASDNKFYHNNFIDNTQQVYIPMSGYANVWDDGYPSGGNYWTNYTGADFYSGAYQNETGSDGIGDDPYSIDVHNQDDYPLMSPFTLLYYELLEAYNALLADYQDLNSTYYGLLSDYSELQSNYNSLNLTYYELAQNHTLLQSNFDSIMTSYSELQEQYDSLNSTYNDRLTSYNNLQADYDELQLAQEPIINELNNVRNIMYIFITTTIILVATTVYFAIRKPETRPKRKTKKKP
jgi:parallel beta-helix repeat protein